MTTVRVDDAAIRALGRSDEVRGTLERVADQVAERARQTAPKASGEGAASIGSEVVRDGESLAARVSWDRDHFYMQFVETGTSKMPARPFLRPALDGSYNP